jgi:hypothetical protein
MYQDPVLGASVTCSCLGSQPAADLQRRKNGDFEGWTSGELKLSARLGGEPLHGNGEPLSFDVTFLVPPQER